MGLHETKLQINGNVPSVTSAEGWSSIANFSHHDPDLLQAYAKILLELGRGSSNKEALEKAVDAWSELAAHRLNFLDGLIRDLSRVRAPRRN